MNSKRSTPAIPKNNDDVRILGLDPGFASLGWAVVDTRHGKMTNLVAIGVLRTEKASKKQNTYAADDNFRRAKEIGKFLADIALAQQVDAICAESMSFPRSSSVAAKMAMAWGVIAQICNALFLPMAMATPKAIKKAATGSGAASKDTVQACLAISLPEAIGMVGHIPKGQHEHAFDAIGAVQACLGSEVISALNKSTPI